MAKDYGFQPVPVRGKSGSEFTDEEARLMYDWYLDDLPRRTQYLFDYMNRFTPINLDYSFETFKKVIEWLPQALVTEKKTWFELQSEKKSVSKSDRKLIKKWKFNEDSELLITAIGGYFGMVLEKNVPDTKWVIEDDKSSQYYHFNVINIRDEKKVNPVEVINDLATLMIEKKEINLDHFIKWIIK